MLRSGKYRGNTFEYVKEKDRRYCGWLLDAHREHQSLPRDLRKFAQHLKKEHGGVLQVGCHKGSFFNDVLRDHPDYGEWAAELTQPGDGMKHFSQHATKRRVEAEVNAEKTEPEKKARSDGRDEKKCAVCADGAIQCAFVPCGHMVCCMKCGVGVEDNGCPVCRSDIAMVLKIYT